MGRAPLSLAGPLDWLQVGANDDARYELRSASALHATLRFPSGLGSRLNGSLALGACLESAWEFDERPAQVGRRIEISVAAGRVAFAVFHASTRILALRNARRYRWQSLPSSQWCFSVRRDDMAVRFARRDEMARVARVEIAPAAAGLPDLDLLVVLGGLLLVLHSRDLADGAEEEPGDLDDDAEPSERKRTARDESQDDDGDCGPDLDID